MNNLEKILKEFDEKFKYLYGNKFAYDTDFPKVKSFISKVCEQAYEEGRKTDNQIPMGASQWLEHGKKYGYDEFFEKKAYKAGKREALEEADKLIGQAHSDGFIEGRQEAIGEIENLFNSLKITAVEEMNGEDVKKAGLMQDLYDYIIKEKILSTLSSLKNKSL